MDVGVFHLVTNSNGGFNAILEEEVVFNESIKADFARLQNMDLIECIDVRCLQFTSVQSASQISKYFEPWAAAITPFLVHDNIKQILVATENITRKLRGICGKLLLQHLQTLLPRKSFNLFDRQFATKQLFSHSQFTDKIQSPVDIQQNGCYRRKKRRPTSFKCYMCKRIHRAIGTSSSDKRNICPACRLTNLEMNNLRTDLTGKYAVVTGGRIKIGYQVVLKLLRDRCNVVVTTRFPNDAAKRYSQETDFPTLKNRLKIYQLDLQDGIGIHKFINWLKCNIPHLDILINNAAQTIRRPTAFYQHLLTVEDSPSAELLPLLVPIDRSLPSIEDKIYPPQKSLPSVGGNEISLAQPHFPPGCLDADGQQVDLRPTNSWKALMDDIPLAELLEVTMTNCVAPFILCKELKSLMCASPNPRKFIINVSAMEGQFGRQGKTKFHPHTNMAKAGLNMLTRTAGLEYREDNIYMTSVDTGWVTDERPLPTAEYLRDECGFNVPLTVEDGAARVYSPIALGLNHTDEPHYAVFLKDFHPHPW